MDITISDLKDVFKNHSSGDQHAVGSAEHDYDFEGVTSRTLYPNLKIVSDQKNLNKQQFIFQLI